MNDLRASSDQQRTADARELGALGYAQELFRTMGGFSNFAINAFARTSPLISRRPR